MNSADYFRSLFVGMPDVIPGTRKNYDHVLLSAWNNRPKVKPDHGLNAAWEAGFLTALYAMRCNTMPDAYLRTADTWRFQTQIDRTVRKLRQENGLQPFKAASGANHYYRNIMADNGLGNF
jgi:hypothetical protein